MGVYVILLDGTLVWEESIPEGSDTMTIVYGTVGTVDRNAVCDDPTCAQYGETMGSHRVVHRPQPERGQKGDCPYCKQKLHNWHDADMTIQLQCQLRQIFSPAQLKEVESLNAVIHDQISKAIKEGKITQWATLPRVRELTEAAKGIPPVNPRGSATATGTTPVANGQVQATTTPTSPASATPVATTSTAVPPVGAASVAPAVQVPPSSTSKVVPPDVAARLAQIMGGARVNP